MFDFDPARTLIIYEQFANDLCADTSDGRGDSDTRKEHIRTLINFFPVIGEDEEGRMIELNAEQVLSIPRKIKSKEVVRCGFMSDFLFQNITNIFRAPQEILDIIKKFTPMEEQKTPNMSVTPETAGKLSLDENGEVSLDDAYVIGRSADVFGDKIFQEVPEDIYDVLDNLTHETEKTEDPLAKLKEAAHKNVLQPVIERAKEEYGRNLRPSEQKKFESKAKEETNQRITRLYDDYSIQQRERELQHSKDLGQADTVQQSDEVNRRFEEEQRQADVQLQNDLLMALDEVRQNTQQEIIRAVETSMKEQEKKGYEEDARKHLRGFARTIPSFLMAYGSEDVTLATFDQIIPADVFKDVTSISLADFCLLRDGGSYTNKQTGLEEHFDGHLFDPVVFDDSVREFLRVRERLADYFDESSTEDIFDYIPPQKTNQIFTPRRIVQQMVDLLEQENPGCYDDPEKTFIDPYMKSGMYITEIVKRLYRSERMKEIYPDNDERLCHIFAHQVYGLAPTEIIYRIALSYILGFSQTHPITEHHFRQADVLSLVKEGSLESKLDELFG